MKSNRNQKNRVPETPLALMKAIYKQVLPNVHDSLEMWKHKAQSIPNVELKEQALASITSKQFHCEGGSIYALLSQQKKQQSVLKFIVAYQTISDYLDNLCDRSVSLDGKNFRQLHESMVDAVSCTLSETDYYAYQDDKNDGEYLLALVKTCHEAIQELPSYHLYKEKIMKLCQWYCDLQVYKHIDWNRREQALLNWWKEHESAFPQLEWYEFAAATGSTLCIFYYVALASHESTEELNHNHLQLSSNDNRGPKQNENDAVFDAYFPYVQGLHILLDYLIDQDEDRKEGDLNFCFYYESEEYKLKRLEWMVNEARQKVSDLPHARFHQMIVEGLLGMYLADEKVKNQKDVLTISRQLLKRRKLSTWFFFLNAWVIHRKGKKV